MREEKGTSTTSLTKKSVRKAKDSTLKPLGTSVTYLMVPAAGEKRESERQKPGGLRGEREKKKKE